MEDKINVCILTVSDSCFEGKAEDGSGNNLEQIVNNARGHSMVVIMRERVPDDLEVIRNALIKLCDDKTLHVILTTGGTGFGHRDNTPEATRLVIEKEATGFTTAMLIEGLKKTEFAMLSRAVCGVRKNKLIINLPGSKKGSEESLHAVMNCIPHAVSLLMNKTEDIKMEHAVIQKEIGDNVSSNHNVKPHHRHHHHHHQHHHPTNHGDHKSQVDISRVARRPREQVAFPMIALDNAIDIVINHASHTEIEKIDLRDEESRLKVIGHVLAGDVVSIEPFPPFPASIKDGYAVRAIDGAGPRKVVGLRVAGSPPDLHAEGESICVRVNTGAPVPQGMDAVVQVEDTELIEEADDGRTEVSINILTKPVRGQDIRAVGSDIPKGQMVMETNTIITSTGLGLLATLGINEIKVFKFPRIGVLSTGDELTDPWSKDGLKPGCIRDSNKVTLMRLLEENGFKAVDCGIAQDSPDDVFKKMSSALENVDVLITSGSVSMGEKDVIKSVLRTDLNAEIHFGRVNMKPGKPMTFATCCSSNGKKKLVFALPGNPSSAVLTCHVFVLPAIRKLTGRAQFHNELVVVKLNERVDLDFRPELMRAVLYLKPKNSKRGNQGGVPVCSLPDKSDNDYEIIGSTTGNQISSRLASFKHANGLLCLPSRSTELSSIEAGSFVNAYVIGKLNH